MCELGAGIGGSIFSCQARGSLSRIRVVEYWAKNRRVPMTALQVAMEDAGGRVTIQQGNSATPRVHVPPTAFHFGKPATPVIVTTSLGFDNSSHEVGYLSAQTTLSSRASTDLCTDYRKESACHTVSHSHVRLRRLKRRSDSEIRGRRYRRLPAMLRNKNLLF